MKAIQIQFFLNFSSTAILFNFVFMKEELKALKKVQSNAFLC